CWIFPVALLGAVVFLAAGLSLNIGLITLILSVLVSWCICYGIVGMAIGLGARYANFNWEHSSQLAAGFGNMVFMLSSVTLISLNLIPAGCMLFTHNKVVQPYLVVGMLLVIFFL